MTDRDIAHAALSLTEPPYLKHYREGRFREWRGVAFVASELPGPGFCFAAVLRHNAPSLDELLPVAREFFAGSDQGWGVLVEGDAGHPMEAELRARGWAVAEDEPAYVLRDLAAVTPRVGSELIVRVAQTQADADAYKAVTAAAFEAPPEMADLMVPSLAFALDPDIALVIGSIGGVDVTAAGYSRSGTTAVLWGVATLESHRGRGYGDAVSREALRHAATRGCTSAALRSGPKSIPVYERHRLPLRLPAPHLHAPHRSVTHRSTAPPFAVQSSHAPFRTHHRRRRADRVGAAAGVRARTVSRRRRRDRRRRTREGQASTRRTWCSSTCGCPAWTASPRSANSRSVAPAAAVVVITAHGNLNTAVKAVEGGAFDYLAKPFDLAQALDAAEAGAHVDWRAGGVSPLMRSQRS